MKRILFAVATVVLLAGMFCLSGCCCNKLGGCRLFDGCCGTCADCPETCQSCGCGRCGGQVVDASDGGAFGQGTGGTVAYPYYTTRGPRDFLAKNPRGIGP